jgi:hypothetical protein
VNKSFTASGRLEVTLTRGWEQHPVLSRRNTGESTLEDQLPALIQLLEIDKAEGDWARLEEERRSEIREERWKQVKKEAFVRVAYQRNAQRLLAELDSRDAAATMRAYARRDRSTCCGPVGLGRASGTLVGRVDPPACRTHGPAKQATAHRGSHLVQPRRTPAAHARLEHPRTVPALSAACLR